MRHRVKRFFLYPSRNFILEFRLPCHEWEERKRKGSSCVPKNSRREEKFWAPRISVNFSPLVLIFTLGKVLILIVFLTFLSFPLHFFLSFILFSLPRELKWNWKTNDIFFGWCMRTWERGWDDEIYASQNHASSLMWVQHTFQYIRHGLLSVAQTFLKFYIVFKLILIENVLKFISRGFSHQF